ncbi:MAG: threonine/serine dehydratase [Pseudomonadota bacterium]
MKRALKRPPLTSLAARRPIVQNRDMDHVTPEKIEAAATTIAGHVRKTPTFTLDGPHPIALKLEHLQRTGSFKARGAFNTLMTIPVSPAGVTAASGGNHGVAVATAAAALGHTATIFVPEIVNPAKLAAIKATGATVHITGARYSDAYDALRQHVDQTGAAVIEAYDHPKTIAGQGTVALEWERQSDALDTVFIAVGGGGLIAGVAAWFAGRTRVIGVEPETSCCLAAALDAGEPVDVDVSGVAADSLGARRIGAAPFAIAQQHVERVIRVPDEAIQAAQKDLWHRARIVAEPGGAAAYAALLSGRYQPAEAERVGVLICGANTQTAPWTL